MEIIRNIIGLVTDYSFDWDYISVLENAISRIENWDDDEEIHQALDDSLIYYVDQWTIMAHHQDPKDANLYDAFEDTIEDIYEYIAIYKQHYAI